MPYDPQRSHRRPPAPDDDPAPVDALLEPAADAPPVLPEGVSVDVEDGEVVVHTADADVEVTTRGDDVVIHTETADVEVLAEAEEVVVSSPREEVFVDLRDGSVVVDASGGGRRRALVPVVVAALALAAFLVWRRRHR